MVLHSNRVGRLLHRPSKHAHALEVLWLEEWPKGILPRDKKGPRAGVSHLRSRVGWESRRC